jgi:methylenetetrahydrofolate dehydrogenase (NADP+)/methenyltetrahydrofolate cyclohydrolase
MIVGDVDYESVKDVAAWITPVPGGVGVVTTAVLMRNTLIALRRQKAVYEAAFGRKSEAAEPVDSPQEQGLVASKDG